MPIIPQRSATSEEWRPGVITRMVVSARSGATQPCIFEQWISPGAGAPLHEHRVEDVLTVLAGVASITLDGNTASFSAGQAILVAAYSQHAVVNHGSDGLHLPAVLASAVFEARGEGTDRFERRWDIDSG